MSKNDKISLLKQAIFDESGKDKNVIESISPAFLKYDRNLDSPVSIQFSSKLDKDALAWAFDTVKTNMEDLYDKSGYGWEDDDKMSELTEDGARFLLVRDYESCLVGFAHFRFTFQGEIMDVMEGEPSLHLWDLHIDEEYRGKGLGKHLLLILELVARQQKMSVISLPVQLCDEAAAQWISRVKGYAKDATLKSLVGFDSELEVGLILIIP